MRAAYPAACAVALWAALGSCGAPTETPSRCSVDGECPLHQYCEAGECRTGCVSDVVCGDRVCTEHGRCVVRGSDGGVGGGGGADLGTSVNLAPPDLSPRPDGAPTASCGVLTGAVASQIDPATGHCYVTWPGPVSWAMANRACQAQGGTLAVITSAAEDAVVRAVAGAQPRWIGLASHKPGGQAWTWASGEARSFDGWAAGEPTNTGGSEDCVLMDAQRGWDDETCGFPTSGNLDPSLANAFGFVCENSCGNGALNPGEGCDPPGPACTATCQTRRACTEAGAVSSPINGHCYFSAGPATNHATALTACPAGTHLATVADAAEAEAAMAAATVESWLALKAPNSNKLFEWQTGAKDFNFRLFHNFVQGEPNTNAAPVCVRASATGWKDNACNSAFAHLCERD